MNDNYSAWQINQNDFSESWPDIQKLLFFARYAILAPSGHNTQPWHFSKADNQLQLKISAERQLPFSGKIAGEPYISIGTCLETFLLAAQGFGYDVQVDYPLKGDLVAVMSLSNKTKADPSLLDAITNRSSNRYFYDDEPIAKNVLETITKNAKGDVFTQSITNSDDLKFLADQTNQATITLFGEPKFREELSKWVRNNLTKQFDGMPGFAQKIPTPPSLIAKHLIKHINIAKDQAKKDTALVLHSPAIILVAVKAINDRAFLDAGRAFARVCILAQQQGLASSGVGAAIIDPVSRKAVAEHFNIDYQPVGMVRVGRTSKKVRHTPRWPLEKVLD